MAKCLKTSVTSARVPRDGMGCVRIALEAYTRSTSGPMEGEGLMQRVRWKGPYASVFWLHCRGLLGMGVDIVRMHVHRSVWLTDSWNHPST